MKATEQKGKNMFNHVTRYGAPARRDALNLIDNSAVMARLAARYPQASVDGFTSLLGMIAHQGFIDARQTVIFTDEGHMLENFGFDYPKGTFI